MDTSWPLKSHLLPVKNHMHERTSMTAPTPAGFTADSLREGRPKRGAVLLSIRTYARTSAKTHVTQRHTFPLSLCHQLGKHGVGKPLKGSQAFANALLGCLLPCLCFL